MVDASIAAESSNVTVDLVEKSKSKQLVVVGPGEYREYQDRQDKNKVNKKLVVPVEIDGKAKDWVLNKPSAEKMVEVCGSDTDGWLSRIVRLEIIKTQQGQKMIMAFPVVADEGPAAPRQPVAAVSQAPATKTPEGTSADVVEESVVEEKLQ